MSNEETVENILGPKSETVETILGPRPKLRSPKGELGELLWQGFGPKPAYEYVKEQIAGIPKMIAGFPPPTQEMIAQGNISPGASPVEGWEAIKTMAERAPLLGKRWFEVTRDRWMNLKKTLQTSPTGGYGLLGDVAALLWPAGKGLEAVGLATKVPWIAKAGTALGTVSQFVEPTSLVGEVMTVPRRIVGMSSAPMDLLEATMKIPPGQVSAVERTKIFETLLGEKFTISASSWRKMSKEIKTLTTDYEGVLEDLSAFKGSDFDVYLITSKLDALKLKYKDYLKPQEYYDAIDVVKQDLIGKAFLNNGRINLAEANNIKKSIYEEIARFYAKSKGPETKRIGIRTDIDAEAKAEAATALRDAIIYHPDVPADVVAKMERTAGLMNARKWVERATNRGGNLDILSLSGMLFGVLVEQGLPVASAYRIVMSQRSLSKLALIGKHGIGKLPMWPRFVGPQVEKSQIPGNVITGRPPEPKMSTENDIKRLYMDGMISKEAAVQILVDQYGMEP